MRLLALRFQPFLQTLFVLLDCMTLCFSFLFMSNVLRIQLHRRLPVSGIWPAKDTVCFCLPPPVVSVFLFFQSFPVSFIVPTVRGVFSPRLGKRWTGALSLSVFYPSLFTCLISWPRTAAYSSVIRKWIA